ncbi:hypothetical cyanophage protein [Synechococcus phage S-CRM01]|uniref:virion structural protein n=1 Tax=Synechococcus phage S-CRM01 TaxID=1026955 RepID=UPI000209E334|nr:virion structural protein [Synechococcus phage S-CRM01]AEC52958.1 hypothetical cyanophage protein [Synechococcus phage S-CRM01]
MKQPVAGYNNLYKDSQTGVIVNRESVERERYRIARQQARMNIDSRHQIAVLKQEIDEIKSLLQQLINK